MCQKIKHLLKVTIHRVRVLKGCRLCHPWSRTPREVHSGAVQMPLMPVGTTGTHTKQYGLSQAEHVAKLHEHVARWNGRMRVIQDCDSCPASVHLPRYALPQALIRPLSVRAKNVESHPVHEDLDLRRDGIVVTLSAICGAEWHHQEE